MCLVNANQKKVILMKRNKSYEKCMFNQMKPIFGRTFCTFWKGKLRDPYFNQVLKFLQLFKVFNILSYHCPYLGS